MQRYALFFFLIFVVFLTGALAWASAMPGEERNWWLGVVIGIGIGWTSSQLARIRARKVAEARFEALMPKLPTPKPTAPKPLARSEAITLLAALQREARFVDFIQESLAGYNDAQIGAVARDVHRDCGKVLNRMFALRPAVAADEGSDVEVPPGFDAGSWRLTGNVTGEPPFRGRLVHPGWEASQCELPSWSGSAASARIVAPAEVELQ